MNLFKRTVNRLLAILGYRLVKLDNEKNKPIFQNFFKIIDAYEYIFTKYRKNNIIPMNSMRSELTTRLLGTPPSEAYFIIEAISKTNMIQGDICEFGVAQGETSALMANEIRETNKKLHLFDSFQGLPKPSANDNLKDDIFRLGSIKKYEGQMSCNKELVERRLNEISFDKERYIIHEGFFDEIISSDKHLPVKVVFAYIDFDFYEPILLALNFLHVVTPKGGIIIVDDYDFFSTGVKTATDEFISDKNKVEKFYEIEVPDKCFGCFAILYKVK